jgi:hypothetical protein
MHQGVRDWLVLVTSSSWRSNHDLSNIITRITQHVIIMHVHLCAYYCWETMDGLLIHTGCIRYWRHDLGSIPFTRELAQTVRSLVSLLGVNMAIDVFTCI